MTTRDDVLELTIAFQPIEPDDDTWPVGFSVRCPGVGASWDGGQFINPLDDKALGEIRWYLEEYPKWPTDIDRDRVHRVEKNLNRWGRDLFNGVFDRRPAARIYQRFLDHEATQRRVIIEAQSPQVQRLPWELLAESTGPLFSRRVPISIYRRVHLEHWPEVRTFGLPLRVLMVTSRPESAGFIDPRSVARGMLHALASLIAEGRVVVDFLRPPTLAALDEALREGDRKGHPYHIVHFDGHGVYHRQTGLGQLAFEHDDCSQDMVDANRLGTLLQECGVPLMVLNACQSAQGDQTNPFSSVATRLIEAGVGGVLSMSHSVLVATASKFVEAFYRALVNGDTVGRATDEARRALEHDLRRLPLEHEEGRAYLELHDWFLPVLYQQQTDASPFAPDLTGFAKPARPAVTLYGLPTEPLHGFVGRAWELLALERRFRDHGIVVLHGWGGIGKTALAAEAARWFIRTGLFRDAAFVSFEHCQSAEYALAEVGRALVEPNFNVGADAGDPVGRVSKKLRQRPALIIFDNFESALGRDALLSTDDLRAVLGAAKAWADVDGSRVLITTRDITFGDAALAPGKLTAHLELKGLAAPDALLLAAEILKNNSIDRERVPREGLERLMRKLGAHPLSLELVLPHLRTRTADQLAEEFSNLLDEFRRGRGKTRNENLLVSLDMSLRRLSDETRAALPDLAVFQGGAFEDNLLEITGMDPDLWGAARAELEQAALVTVESLPGVVPPFLRFHPTLVPYLASQLPAARRAELEERYWQRYYALADYLYNADTQTPHQARAIAQRELPNLHRALDLAIAASAAAEEVDFATRIARFLDNFDRWRERDTMMEKISHLQSQISSEEGVTEAEYLMLSQRGDVLLQQGRASEAEQVFRGLLERLEAGAAYDAAYDHAMTLYSLGRCLAAQRQPAQAVEWQRRALEEFERRSESSEQAKRMAAACHVDWADNLRDIGQFDEAQKHYETALPAVREIDDHRSVGVTLGQLGTLALLRGDLAEAARRYSEALETFRALGEPQQEAVAWHQLGMVAQKARDWDEAERCYREAVRIREQIRDLPLLATTCNQLANVARGAGRPHGAERWYLRTIEYAKYLPDQGAAVYNNLASLYLSQGRLDEAARYAHQAVDIVEQHHIQTEVWKMYSLLAEIAEAQGRADEAAEWRRKEQESYAAYAGAAHEMQQYQPLIQAVVAACQGSEEARRQLEPTLQHIEGIDEVNRRFALAARRILEGERDGDALTEGVSHTPALIIRTILAQLSGEQAPTPPAAQASPPPRAGEGLGEGAAAIAQLRQQWAPVVQAVVAACQGDAAAAAQLEPLLVQFSQQDDWRHLAAALRRILSGERDPAALLSGLDATDTLIAGDVLRALGVDISPPLAGEGLGEGSEPGEGAMTLDDLLGMVALACTSDAPPGLAEQLHGLTRTLAADPNAPTEVRALGRALNAVLSGDRAPDLSALPPELAEALQRLLKAIT